MDPKLELEKFKNIFEPELEKYLLGKEKQYRSISPFTHNVFKNISEFTLRGGKRLRPALLYHSYKLFGGTDYKEAIRLSMFVELIQSYLLIHDDIFDRAEKRRNGLTFHKIYEKYSKKNGWGDPAHVGRTMAILAGDIASHMANDLIGNSKFPEDRKNKVLNIATSLTINVLIGQIEDFIISFKPEFTEKDIKNIHQYKTAAYTFEMPLLAGALLAGQKETNKHIISLKKYANYAGLAFQVRDDILGVFGDEGKTGKPAISDIKEGKRTLLVLKAEQNANKKQLSTIKNILGKKNLINKEAEEFRNVILETGSLEYSTKVCEKYVAEAKKSLLEIKKTNESWEFLEAIADFLIVREL